MPLVRLAALLLLCAARAARGAVTASGTVYSLPSNKKGCGASICHHRHASHAVAAWLCAEIGGRLCRTEELDADFARETGCGLDSRRTWHV